MAPVVAATPSSGADADWGGAGDMTKTFFKVSDHPGSLSSMSLLGETSSRSVDLFAQTFCVLRELDASSVLVFPNNGIMIAARLYASSCQQRNL